MGCDIHMRAEVKKKNSWKLCGKIFENEYYRLENPIDNWNQPKTSEPYGNRNYNLFAILADVRNGRGFAGIKTGDGFNYIDEPRGAPEDISKEGLKFMESYGGDGHSHSWFTLQELLDFDWSQLTKQCGWVTPEEFEVYQKEGKPSDWCGDVSGGRVKKISVAEMITTESFDDNFSYYTFVEWGTSYMDAVGKYWFEKTLPALQSLGNPEDVRIIFFFDN